MSTEHEKEPGAALKRPRGVDGGVESLAGAGLQLGSPDKKKRKGGAQGAPFLAPPSEYAPPPNPSAEHLIAANPFDDSYAAAAAYKPVSGPYFAGPAYPGFGGYNAFRMPPHLLPRFGSPYGAPAFPLRHRPTPFGQSPSGAAFCRAPAVTFGSPENAAGFGHQPSYSTSQAMSGPGLPFRPNPRENFGHIPSQNASPMPPATGHLKPGPSPAFGSSLTEPNHSYAPGLNSYNQAKGFPKLGVSKHQSLPQQYHPTALGAEGLLSSGSTDVKASGHQRVPAGTPEGILPKDMENLNSAHANGTHAKPCLPHGGPEGSILEKGGGSSGGSKIPVHPLQHDHLSEPVYPCGICTHEVNDDQDAILCEASCQKWFHRICTGMTESAYGLLTAEASAVWGCDTCMADKDVQLMRTREMVGPPALNTDV